MVWRALDGIDDLMLAGTWDNSSRTVSIQKVNENYETFYNINSIQYYSPNIHKYKGKITSFSIKGCDM